MNTAKFIVEKTGTGYSAYMNDLPVYTTGSTMSELKNNMFEAYNLYLEEIGKDSIAKQDLVIAFDLPQFFDYYKSEINARGLAKRIGMNEQLLSHYIKGVKIPSEKQIQKILAGIKSLGNELLDFA